MSGLQHGGDFLIILLDVPLLAESLPPKSSQDAGGQTSSLLEQVLYFIAVYFMVSEGNMLAVYGLMDNVCEALYVSLKDGTPEPSGSPTEAVHRAILDMLQRHPVRGPSLSSQPGTSNASPPPRTIAISAGLSRALCLVHRIQTAIGEATGGAAAAGAAPAAGADDPTAHAHAYAAPARLRPRILCVLGCPDAQPQYIATMNAIFSAQRADVTIDTLQLGPTNSTYLQQAAALTGGLYLQVPAQPPTQPPRGAAPSATGPSHAGGAAPQSARSALQYLLSTMALDRNVRGMLAINQPLGVDFRASCFCHRRPVDVGYVCSVCLSIYCGRYAECGTCGAVFNDEPKKPG